MQQYNIQIIPSYKDPKLYKQIIQINNIKTNMMKLDKNGLVDKDLASVNFAHSRPVQSRRQMLLSVVSPNFDNYPAIHTFEFTHSYLNKYETYSELVSQLNTFNEQLTQWKNGNNDPRFKNIILIYNVYKNLAERLKTLSYIHGNLQKQLSIIKNWLFETKMKGLVSRMGNIANLMKIVANEKKKSAKEEQQEELYMYLKKERTEHPDFRLPKERLIEYKRKDIEVPNFQQSLLSNRNVKTFSSASKDQKGFTTLRTNQQFTTINKQSSAKQILSDQKHPISITVEQLNLIEDKNQAQLEEDSAVYQEEDIKKPIKKPFLSDSINKQAYNNQLQPELKTSGNFYKSESLTNHIRFKNDNKQLEQIKLDHQAKQKIQSWSKLKSKSAQRLDRKIQSSRTHNRYIQQQFKAKNIIQYEDLNFQSSDIISKTNPEKKSRKKLLFDQEIDTNSDLIFKIVRKPKKQSIQPPQQQHLQHRRKVLSQKLQIPFQKKQQKIISKNNILESKNKISQQMEIQKQHQKNSSIETKQKPQNFIYIIDNKNQPKIFLENALKTNIEIDRYKLSRTISTFEKHIIHHRPTTNQSDRVDLIDNQRSFKKEHGLTHRFNSAKSLPFAEILFKNHADIHNAENQTTISKIKTVLSHKGVTINSQTINNSMKIPIEAKYITNEKVHKAGDRLLSNPFFPKNLYTAKKKKKSKK